MKTNPRMWPPHVMNPLDPCFSVIAGRSLMAPTRLSCSWVGPEMKSSRSPPHRWDVAQPNNSTIRDGGCRRQRQPSPRTSRALLTFTPTTTNPAPIPTPGRWEVGDLCPKALASSVAVLPRVNPRLGQTDCRRGDRRRHVGLPTDRRAAALAVVI